MKKITGVTLLIGAVGLLLLGVWVVLTPAPIIIEVPEWSWGPILLVVLWLIVVALDNFKNSS